MTEFRPGRFEVLPTVVKNLIIINTLVYIAQVTVGNKIPLEPLFALHTWQSDLFKPWQFVTYMFMHGSPMHLFFNMFGLWMFGATLENIWGPKRFITFYMACGLGAALTQMLAQYVENQSLIHQFYSLSPQDQSFYHYKFLLKLDGYTVGASGAISGCLVAFGYLFPNSYLFILPIPFPIKVKWAVIGILALDVYSSIRSNPGDNVAHIAHLGGALIGFLLVYFWNKTNRNRFY
jgi:membrane associated rhomboid family serine protease